MSDAVRVAFDIGGVLSKYPGIWRPIFHVLARAPGIDVYVISDMKPHAKTMAFCHDNGFMVPAEQIRCADYETYGELCKAVLCRELGIDVLIDDHMGYLVTADQPLVRLLVMPDPLLPYYHNDWKTDGSEGNFGRRNPPGSKRPTEDRGKTEVHIFSGNLQAPCRLCSKMFKDHVMVTTNNLERPYELRCPQ